MPFIRKFTEKENIILRHCVSQTNFFYVYILYSVTGEMQEKFIHEKFNFLNR